MARSAKTLASTFDEDNEKNLAVELYMDAYRLAPQVFDYDEKIAIAKMLIALNRQHDATTLLQDIMHEPHQGFVAELTLAKLLAANYENEKERSTEFYVQALKFAPQAFNYDEKIAISKLLITAKRRQDAIALLQKMTTEPHHGFTAELALAKLLAATGEYNAALGEANEILQRDQKNYGALFIKGNALQRRKAFGDAIQAYRSALEKQDDFDARLGLVYSLLAIGQKQEAEKQFNLLHAEDEWQQSDLTELARTIDINVRPVVEYMNTTFSDNDNYRGVEQDFNAKANFSDWEVSLSARHRTATGEGISAIADTGILFVGKNISELLRVLAGVGVCDLSWQKETSPVQQEKPFSIGEIRLDAQVWNGTAQLSYTSQALTANALLISNVVGVKRSEVVYNKPFNKVVTLKATFRNSAFTDRNSAQDFEGLTLLALNSGAPQFSLGYGYRNLNYRQPSTKGYFDPQDYVAHKLLFLAAYEHGPYYLYTEFAYGLQNYTRNQNNETDKFDHLGLTTGTTLWQGFRVELSAERNNSSAERSDYEYGDRSFSVRLSYSL